MIVETTDEDAAREALEKASDREASERSYEGTDYLLEDETASGLIDGRAVVGTEAGFKAAVDSGESGDSIEGSERVEEALDSTLPAELIGLAAPLFFGSGTDAVQELPADSFFAAGQPEVGESISQLVGLFAGAAGGQQQIEEQVRRETGLDLDDDILSWMGDLGIYASGTSLQELGAGAVIETKDPGTSRRTLEVVGRLARRDADPTVTVSPLRLPGGGDGFTVQSAELPQPVHVVQRGERVAIALGDESAEALLEPADTLGEDPDFGAASGRLGEGFEASNYLDFAPILELAESEGAAEDGEYQKAKPYLEPFVRLVAGTKEDGDVVLSRTRVEFR